MKHIYRIFIVVSVVSLAILVTFAYKIKPKYENKGINKLKAEENHTTKEDKKIDIFNGKDIVRILVLGVDKTATQNMDSEKNGMRSDTIMLVTIDKTKDSAQIMSIPRDSFVKIHGYGENKINAAFNNIVYPKDGGFELVAKTVEDFLKVEIDHYAIVDYKTVSGVVDALGGIDIDWKYPDYKYRDDWTVPPLVIDLKNGINHLDGEKAMSYLRARKVYPDQDLDRIKAQQEFLMLMFDKLKSGASIVAIPKILDVVDRYIETDLNYGEISAFAYYGMKMDKSNIYKYTVKKTGSKRVLMGKDEIEVILVDRGDAIKHAQDISLIDEEVVEDINADGSN